MRLSFSSDHLRNTDLVDDSGRKIYTIKANKHHPDGTTILKFGSDPSTPDPSNLAVINFRVFYSDTIDMGGRKLVAKRYLRKPDRYSSRRVFTTANQSTYEWDPQFNERDEWVVKPVDNMNDQSEPIGRSHPRSLGSKRPEDHAYLEFSDDPRVLEILDELIIAFVYLRIKKGKEYLGEPTKAVTQVGVSS